MQRLSLAQAEITRLREVCLGVAGIIECASMFGIYIDKSDGARFVKIRDSLAEELIKELRGNDAPACLPPTASPSDCCAGTDCAECPAATPTECDELVYPSKSGTSEPVAHQSGCGAWCEHYTDPFTCPSSCEYAR